MRPEPERASSDDAAWTLHDDRDEIRRVESLFVEHLKKHQYPEAAIFACRLAMEEAVVNAFRHGHAALPKNTPIDVAWRIGPDQVELTVEDQGPGFDPSDIPDPTLDENIQAPSGRGIMLIRAYMAEVDFNQTGNRLRMVFKHPESASD